MKLFTHQMKALQWVNGKDNFPCFMEMRTGKSLVAITKCKQWGGKVLLIAPISTWFDWAHLLHYYNITTTTLHGSTKQKQQQFAQTRDIADWVIINPEGVTKWGKDFFNSIIEDYDICILDESVFIKNPRAKITKLLMKYKKQFKHRIVMTGTPIAETTEDIVNQMIWCNGEFMWQDNFYKWRMKYMQPARFGWRLKKGVKQLLREELKKDSFVLSAKDAGLFVQQSKRVRLIELPLEIKDDYREIERAWKLGEAITKYGVAKDIWLSQLACGIYPKAMDSAKLDMCFKVKAVKELLEGELRGEQVIIFSRWLKEVYTISDALHCAHIIGNTPFNIRDQLLNLFRQGVDKYLVVQTKCACRGLDLSCCNTAIMTSNYWQYEIRQQILARMKHPFKKIPTLFIDIIAKDTIEEKVYEVLNEKHVNARYFLQRLRAKVR